MSHRNARLTVHGRRLLVHRVRVLGMPVAHVAKAMGIEVRSGRVVAEGDLDFRGTLGVSKETPVGFSQIRLRFEVETDATDEQQATLLRLAERYCVIYQTLKSPPTLSATIA